MKFPQRSFTDSLSYTLARNSVLVTLMVGLLLSCVQIAIDFMREQDATEKFALEILAANQFAAADATFHLDEPAAEEVAKGILQYHAITSLIISNESNDVLAQLDPLSVEETSLISGHEIFGNIKRFSQVLYLDSGENVGTLTLFVDPALAAAGFFDRSLLVIISGLVRNVLLAFILIYVFYRTTTKKVIDIGSALKDLDLDNPQKNRIPQIHTDRKNEFDDLRESINRMLDRISNDITKRKEHEQDLYSSQKELFYQENHDMLSGLVNRRGFERYLLQSMENRAGDNADNIFCYLDLDHFKIINDTC
jgi:methyl-accepting chemotaxis protein